jgi:uncharacterized protein YndB with AHSA1/START domain
MEAPIERIWSVVSTVEQLPRWLANARGAQTLSGAGLGRRQRLHGSRGRRETETDQVVVAWDPPRHIAWETEAERLDGEAEGGLARATRFGVQLEPAEGGTRVRLISEREPGSPVKGLLIHAVNIRFQKTRRVLDASLIRLADLVEQSVR